MIKRKDLDNYAMKIVFGEPYEYEDCYVAFLDILSFKKIIDGKECVDIKTIYDTIRCIVYENNHSDFFYAVISKEIIESTKMNIMSDSIVVGLPKCGDGFLALLMLCMNIQLKLLDFDIPILIRGGINGGDFFCHNNTTFGPAHVGVYYLENNIAKSPRIVMTQKLFNEALSSVTEKNKIVVRTFTSIDEDGYIFIDYLHMIFIIPLTENGRAQKLKQFIEQTLSSDIDESVRRKYLWLKDKYNISVNKRATMFTALGSERNVPDMYIV